MIFSEYDVYELDIATTLEYSSIYAFFDPSINEKLVQTYPPDEDLQFSECPNLSSVQVYDVIPSSQQILFKDCPDLSEVNAASGTLSFVDCPELQTLSLKQEFADLSNCTSIFELNFEGSQLILPNIYLYELTVFGCTSWNECKGSNLYVDLVSLNSCSRLEFERVHIDCERFSVVDLRNVERNSFCVRRQTVILNRKKEILHCIGVLFLNEKTNTYPLLRKLLLAAFLR